jgi:carboxylesterase type B
MKILRHLLFTAAVVVTALCTQAVAESDEISTPNEALNTQRKLQKMKVASYVSMPSIVTPAPITLVLLNPFTPTLTPPTLPPHLDEFFAQNEVDSDNLIADLSTPNEDLYTQTIPQEIRPGLRGKRNRMRAKRNRMRGKQNLMRISVPNTADEEATSTQSEDKNINKDEKEDVDEDEK